jgi:exodeoxyribonuclease VII large subunit
VSARQPQPEERPYDALTVAELYDEVDDVLGRAFPRSRLLWVRGEIQHVSDRTGHCYLDLVDPDGHRSRQAPVLKVKCWRTTWQPLRASLEREGIRLEPGMVVVMRGSLDFYKPRAEVSFVLAEIDVTALLGGVAARRAALVRTLQAEGLLDRNRSLPVPAVPRRIGLVASPGSEGYRDFVGQLESSGWNFRVTVVRTTVQGRSSHLALTAALRRLRGIECDVAVLVRGGGSKADLAAFDQEAVARAIASMPVPVWTGIGHSGDESVADLVANRAHITPTECGRELVARVARWWEAEVAGPAEVVRRGAERAVHEVEQRSAGARRHLIGAARHQLRRHGDRVAGRAAALQALAPRRVDLEDGSLRHRAGRLSPLALAHVDRGVERVGSMRRLIAAYDVDRQLERGYTLTLDGHGAVVRSARALAPGDAIETRFADGSVRSVVDAGPDQVAGDTGAPDMRGANSSERGQRP